MKKDSKKEIHELLLKIESETYRIRQIFESCITMEHVNNTNRLACAVTSKWYYFADQFGITYAACYIWPMINAAVNDMEKFLREAKRRVAKRRVKKCDGNQ